MFYVRFFTEQKGWSGVEIASCSGDPVPGHQAAERFSGASVIKQVACKEVGSYVLPCMKKHTITTKLTSQRLPKLVSLLDFGDVEVSMVNCLRYLTVHKGWHKRSFEGLVL